MTHRPGAFVIAAALAAGLLAACENTADVAGAPAGAAPAPVTAEAEFRSLVAGRALAFENGDLLRFGEGTFQIDRAGAPFGSGTWDWTDGRYCREGRTLGGAFPRECQRILASDAGIVFVRPDGSQTGVAFAD